jgi:hypothetical protein
LDLYLGLILGPEHVLFSFCSLPGPLVGIFGAGKWGEISSSQSAIMHTIYLCLVFNWTEGSDNWQFLASISLSDRFAEPSLFGLGGSLFGLLPLWSAPFIQASNAFIDRLIVLPVSCFITSSATGPLFFDFSRVSLGSCVVASWSLDCWSEVSVASLG